LGQNGRFLKKKAGRGGFDFENEKPNGRLEEV